jgi:hypothetical protein
MDADARVQVGDRGYAVRDGKQVYGRVAAVSGGQATVTTHKGDEGFTISSDGFIVSHRYVPQEPPKVRQDLLPPRSSSQYR